MTTNNDTTSVPIVKQLNSIFRVLPDEELLDTLRGKTGIKPGDNVNGGIIGYHAYPVSLFLNTLQDFENTFDDTGGNRSTKIIMYSRFFSY